MCCNSHISASLFLSLYHNGFHTNAGSSLSIIVVSEVHDFFIFCAKCLMVQQAETHLGSIISSSSSAYKAQLHLTFCFAGLSRHCCWNFVLFVCVLGVDQFNHWSSGFNLIFFFLSLVLCRGMYVWSRQKSRNAQTTKQLQLCQSSGKIPPVKCHLLTSTRPVHYSKTLPHASCIKIQIDVAGI